MAITGGGEAVSSRLPALDGLRAIAAGMVFLHHAQLPGLQPFTAGMDSGVIIFFALSGYLIYVPFARALARGVSVHLREYAVRRLFRILPAYLVASFGVAAVWYPWLLEDPLGLVLSTQSSIVVVWTLQIEVLFYALIPVFAWAVGRLGSPNRVRVILALSAGSMCFTAVAMARTLMSGHLVWAPTYRRSPRTCGRLVAESSSRNSTSGGLCGAQSRFPLLSPAWR